MTTQAGDNTLADLVFSRLQDELLVLGPDEQQELDPQVVEVYSKVGTMLHRYKSGKLPKAFKVIPVLKNWEAILALTRPEEWTPQATYQATRLFASNLDAKLAHRFYQLVLLEKIKYDIASNRTLNVHLYESVKKAIYKPAAFFKGLVLPLVEAEGTTLREANIFSSILAKTSIPTLHSGAALFQLASSGAGEYSGPRALIMRTLLDKKYALPLRVVEALVDYFCSFLGVVSSETENRVMPVLWQQCLLVFVQRYKFDLSQEQRKRLRNVATKQPHEMVTPEVIRELDESAIVAQSTMQL